MNVHVDREKLQTTMEREFDAPIALLWKANAEPALIPKWWGPRGYETIVDKMDFKEGGEWRYIQKGKDEKGQEAEYAFNGIYKEIKEGESITWTFNFEPIGPGHTITETVYFEDLGNGKSKLRTVSHYNNTEDLDGMVSSGMEQGATETWDRLEELAKTL